MRVNGRSQARGRPTGVQRGLENNIRAKVRGRMRKPELSRRTSLSDFIATFTNCPVLSGAGRGQRNPMQISRS